MPKTLLPCPAALLSAAAVAAVFLLLNMPAALAQSQTRVTQIYRCGPEGRDLRDAPCPEAAGQAPKPISFDQPSAADRRAAQQLAEDDARRARRMEAQRLKDEAEARRRAAPAIAIHGRGQPASATALPGPQIAPPKPPHLPKPPKAPKAERADKHKKDASPAATAPRTPAGSVSRAASSPG